MDIDIAIVVIGKIPSISLVVGRFGGSIGQGGIFFEWVSEGGMGFLGSGHGCWGWCYRVSLLGLWRSLNQWPVLLHQPAHRHW